MLENDVEDRRKSRASLLADTSLDQPQELKEQLAHLNVDLKQEKEEKGMYTGWLYFFCGHLCMQHTSLAWPDCFFPFVLGGGKATQHKRGKKWSGHARLHTYMHALCIQYNIRSVFCVHFRTSYA